MSNGNGQSFLIRSGVTSAVLVPEPSAAAMFVVGAGTLSVLALRRRSARSERLTARP